MDRRRFLGFVVFPAAIAALLAFLFLVAKIDVFRRRTDEDLVKELRAAKDPELRWKAAADLGARKVAAAAPALREALEDPSASVRIHAARALLEIAPAETLADVLRLAGDPSPEVRSAMAFEVGARAREERALPSLRNLLSDPHEEVRWNAAVALARMEDGSGRAVLHQMLRPAAPRSLGGAVRALVPGGEPPPIEPGRKEHEAALKALSFVGDESSIGPLERFIESGIEPDLEPLARAIIDGIRKRQNQDSKNER
jgi:hypothetical protein